MAEALIKKLSVERASSVRLKAAILPPVNLTSEPVICPLDFNLKLEFDDLISSVLTLNPAMEADLNEANPLESILEEAFALVAVTPPI